VRRGVRRSAGVALSAAAMMATPARAWSEAPQDSLRAETRRDSIATDSLPGITLDEALSRAEKIDPDYVLSEGLVDNAAWYSRAAKVSLIAPSISVQTGATKYSSPTFNLGTNTLEDVSMSASATASYDLFSGGGKLAELRRSRASLDSAEAGVTRARYDLAYRTKTDFYGVLADQALSRVAQGRVDRAQEQLAVARARVISGAAVATDSLQQLLELDRARVSLLQQQASLRVSTLQLGRRVGVDGRVTAIAADTGTPPALPFTAADAIEEARRDGPEYVAARATERAGEASLSAAKASYWPQLLVGGQIASYDKNFFPTATSRSALTAQLNFPIWNNGQREIAVSLARTQRDVAVAMRRDKDRAVTRDVTEAYEGYETARASSTIASEARVVAQENYRVQETRYRAGSTAIVDLVNAQVALTEAEAGLVQARYAAKLAQAKLETILGKTIK